mgnify:CR=1 FL=1
MLTIAILRHKGISIYIKSVERKVWSVEFQNKE